MAIPAWPSTVPSCPIDGTVQVTETAPAPLRTEMNAGTTRVRRKYTVRIARMSFMLSLTNAQAAALQTFHDVTLGDGAARFTVGLLWRAATVTRTCQFADSPSYTPMGPQRQKVSISLLIESL